MRFEDKIKLYSKERIWDEYCGFLEMSISDYMFVQRRLMEEQMHKWCESGLGKSIVGEYVPKSIDEFRGKLSDSELKASDIYYRAQYLDFILHPEEIVNKYPMR